MFVSSKYLTWVYSGIIVIRYATNLENKRVDLFEEPGEGIGEQNVLLASSKQLPLSSTTVLGMRML